MNNSLFRNTSMIFRLNFILDHPDKINPAPFIRSNAIRSPYLNDALWEAFDILPEGKSKRAIGYVARNPGVEFHFGGTDAIGPAIKEAIMLIAKRDLEKKGA